MKLDVSLSGGSPGSGNSPNIAEQRYTEISATTLSADRIIVTGTLMRNNVY